MSVGSHAHKLLIHVDNSAIPFYIFYPHASMLEDGLRIRHGYTTWYTNAVNAYHLQAYINLLNSISSDNLANLLPGAKGGLMSVDVLDLRTKSRLMPQLRDTLDRIGKYTVIPALLQLPLLIMLQHYPFPQQNSFHIESFLSIDTDSFVDLASVYLYSTLLQW